jgi:RNA polymerase sigma-70 factor (ECF subfamily)
MVSDSSDADLVRRAQGGDVDAIGDLYDRHYMQIFRYIWSRVRNERQAEDLTGDVFVRMVTGLPNYRPTNVPFRAWLYRIARNLTIDHHRKTGRRDLVPLYHAESLSRGENEPPAMVERLLTAERVGRALEALDPLQRDVVTLRFLAGLSLREVAATVDKTVAAVKSLQHRGLAALRAALKEG